jgi:drug/metabolite transporter (DMT)-like permease
MIGPCGGICDATAMDSSICYRCHWGSPYLLTKFGLEGLSAPIVAFSRAGVAAVVLVPVLLWLHRTNQGLSATYAFAKKNPVSALLLGIANFALPFSLVSIGELKVSSNLTGILLASIPLIVLVLGPFIEQKKKISFTQLAGVLCGFTGVVLVVGFEMVNSIEEAFYSFALLGAAVSWAYGVYVVNLRFAGVPPLQTASIGVSMGALFLLPAAIATLPDAFPPLRPVLALLFMGSVATGFLFWLYFILIKEIGVSKAVLVVYVEVAFVLFYGATFYAEPITLTAIVGVLLILAGVAIGSSDHGRKKIKKTGITRNLD